MHVVSNTIETMDLCTEAKTNLFSVIVIFSKELTKTTQNTAAPANIFPIIKYTQKEIPAPTINERHINAAR